MIPRYLNESTGSHGRNGNAGILIVFVFALLIGIPIRFAPSCTEVTMWCRCDALRCEGGIKIVPSSAKKRRCVNGKRFCKKDMKMEIYRLNRVGDKQFPCLSP